MSSTAPLSVQDLPLGTVAPDAPYNQMLAKAIASSQLGQPLTDEQIQRLRVARQEIWNQLSREKSDDMGGFARRAAALYGIMLGPQGQLSFPWKTVDHRRIGYESDFYTCDLESRSLAPEKLRHPGSRVIVFATGRAFAEKNARLAHLSTNEAIRNARNVMSAQVYLVGSRLVPDYPSGTTQVVAVAYDMVTSEVETPALRIQAVLDSSFIHPAAKMVAERIFGELIANADYHENGTLVRKHNRVHGRPLPDDEIIENLSGLVLVGGSVGCTVSHQVYGWLRDLLSDLRVSQGTIDAAMRSCLNIHLGPTTHLPADKGINRISVINKSDEFVFAGNDIARLVDESEKKGEPIILDPDPLAKDGHSYHVVLDVPSTLHESPEGWVFDPIGTHFGHSLKHYSNGLRELGLQSVVGRALAHQGPFRLADLIHDATPPQEME